MLGILEYIRAQAASTSSSSSSMGNAQTLTQLEQHYDVCVANPAAYAHNYHGTTCDALARRADALRPLVQCRQKHPKSSWMMKDDPCAAQEKAYINSVHAAPSVAAPPASKEAGALSRQDRKQQQKQLDVQYSEYLQQLHDQQNCAVMNAGACLYEPQIGGQQVCSDMSNAAETGFRLLTCRLQNQQNIFSTPDPCSALQQDFTRAYSKANLAKYCGPLQTYDGLAALSSSATQPAQPRDRRLLGVGVGVGIAVLLAAYVAYVLVKRQRAKRA